MHSSAPKPLLLDTPPAGWCGPDQPSFRNNQVADWIFRRRVTSFDAMSNLPQAVRDLLDSQYSLEAMNLVRTQGSEDTTRKFLWRLNDGNMIESVLIPASPALYGDRADRRTLCISTQVGCAYGCRFCASGLDGFKRNLTPGEIVGQFLATEQITGEKISNVVFMGMGEPLANYDNLLAAIETLNAPWGLALGARHITVSTSGLAPEITKLAGDPRQTRLAISLHGATNEVRSRIMPINKKFPLEMLLKACDAYQRNKQRLITFEFILIRDLNDTPEQARLLAGLCRRYHAKVNLIPYNKVEGFPWERPADPVIHAFAAELRKAGAQATVRREKGHDIAAACGQLRLQTLRSSPPSVAP
jgi:23S rRNA (adenine2503-C2)-methyltransferase